MKTKTKTVQDIFIQKLKETLPPSIGVAEEIAELLDISIDSAYRRIRGETDLSINEIQKITHKHKISLDNIFSSLGDSVTFTYTKLTDSEQNFEKYIARIHDHVKKVNSFPERKMFYVAEEMPIFYSFFDKQLAEFKLFYWQRSVLNVPQYQNIQFEFGKMNPNVLEMAHDAYKEYMKIPSVEIWTETTIHTITKQLEFYAESGVFKNPGDITLLLGKTKEFVQMLKNCTEDGRKQKSDAAETFQLYSSEVVLGTNCIYIKSGELNHAYISFNTMNSLTTSNTEFCDETEHWIRNLIKKSTLISGGAEKQRYQFFNKLTKKIEETEQRLKAI